MSGGTRIGLGPWQWLCILLDRNLRRLLGCVSSSEVRRENATFNTARSMCKGETTQFWLWTAITGSCVRSAMNM
jgi:hypothetical protein